MTSRDEPAGIQSVELGFSLLRALVEAQGPLSLGAIAARTGMSTSKARGYMVSFLRLGLVQQNGEGGAYDLGPSALGLGLAALDRVDAVQLARDSLHELQEATGETVCLSIWGELGPVVFEIADSPRHHPFALRVGSTTRLLSTATGQVFLTFLDERKLADVLDREISDELGLAPDADPEAIRQRVRSAGYAAVSNVTLPGFGSAAAPVFGPSGRLLLVVNVIGPSRTLDLSEGSPVLELLIGFAARISQLAGARPKHAGDGSVKRPGKRGGANS